MFQKVPKLQEFSRNQIVLVRFLEIYDDSPLIASPHNAINSMTKNQHIGTVMTECQKT